MPLFRPDLESESLQEFVRLLTANQGPIRGFIVSLMPGSAGIDDVLQETNLAMWTKRKTFKLGSNFNAWAFTIARYEILRHWDRTRRDGELRLSNKVVNLIAETHHAEIGHEAYLQALDRCLAKLSPKQLALVEHRYTPGKSLERYADRTGGSPGALRVALLRVRKALKHCVESKLEEMIDG